MSASTTFFALAVTPSSVSRSLREPESRVSILPLSQLFQNQTVAELAAVAGTEAGARAEQGALEGNVPLTPIQRWFFEDQPIDVHHFNQAALVEVPEP